MTGKEYYEKRASELGSDITDDHYLYMEGENEIIKAYEAGTIDALQTTSGVIHSLKKENKSLRTIICCTDEIENCNNKLIKEYEAKFKQMDDKIKNMKCCQNCKHFAKKVFQEANAPAFLCDKGGWFAAKVCDEWEVGGV